MAGDRELEIVVRAKDLVSKTMTGISAITGKFGPTAKKAFDVARGAASKAASVISGLGGLLARALKPLSIAAGLLGVGSAGGFAVLIKSAADFGDAIADMSERLGLSTTLLSALRFQAQLSGTSFEAAASGYKLLSRNMFDASRGLGEAVDAFAALRVDVTDASGALRPLEDVIGDVADRIAAMENGSTKTALAMKLFGRSGVDLIPILNLGRDGMAAMAAEAAKLGIVIDEKAAASASRFNDQVDTLFAAFNGLKFAIGVRLFDRLGTLIRDIASVVAANREKIADFFARVANFVLVVIEAVARINNPEVRTRLGGLVNAVFAGIFELAGELAGRVFLDGLFRVLQAGVSKLATPLNFLGDVYRLFGLSAPANISGRDVRKAFGVDGDNNPSRADQDRFAEIAQRNFAQITAAANALDSTMESLRGKGLLGAIVAGDASDVAASIEETQQGLGGFADGIKRITDEMQTRFEAAAEIGARFVAELQPVLSDMFYRVATEWKNAGQILKDTARAILDSVLRIISDFLSSQLIRSLFGLFGGGGAPVLAGVPQSGGGDFLGHGLGGGPSITSPLGGGSGGYGTEGVTAGGQTVVINISAVDGQSVAQLFRRHGHALVAAVTGTASRNNDARASLREALR